VAPGVGALRPGRFWAFGRLVALWPAPEPALLLAVPWRTRGSPTTSTMTVLVSLKEERKAGVLSGGNTVRGTVGLEEEVLASGLPAWRKMTEMWR